MRQPQQNNRNNRQRNRGRRNSGGGNPANKVYDSNGPDVRVRGSAQTVADKYLQLAGDAQSQGDSVTAENYFQHAEHYLRIVAAAQAAREQRQAEKEKAQEEHAARMKAKRARNNENAANAEAAENEKTDSSTEVGDIDEKWEGPKPSFLTGEEADTSEQPKKGRRGSNVRAKAESKKSAKTAAAEAAGSDDAVVASADVDNVGVENPAAE